MEDILRSKHHQPSEEKRTAGIVFSNFVFLFQIQKCVCACSHTCCILRTKIPILLENWEHLENNDILADPHNFKGLFEG